MPSNLSFLDNNFPNFTDEDSTEKKINTIQDYLYMTVESLRYALSHLNEGNMESTFVDSIVQSSGSISEIQQTVAEHTASILLLTETTTEQGENIATLEETVDEQGSSIALVVDNNGIKAGAVISAINGQTSASISADRIAMTGTTTFLTAADVSSTGSTVIDGGRISTGTITFNRLDSSTQSTISNASSTASSAYTMAEDAEDAVSAWKYTGTTYIDGTKIYTGTVTASALRGGSMALIDDNGTNRGTFSISSSSSASYAISISSTAALGLTASAGDMYLSASTTYIHMHYSAGYTQIYPVLSYSNYGTSTPGSSTPGYGILGALYFKYTA